MEPLCNGVLDSNMAIGRAGGHSISLDVVARSQTRLDSPVPEVRLRQNRTSALRRSPLPRMRGGTYPWTKYGEDAPMKIVAIVALFVVNAIGCRSQNVSSPRPPSTNEPASSAAQTPSPNGDRQTNEDRIRIQVLDAKIRMKEQQLQYLDEEILKYRSQGVQDDQKPLSGLLAEHNRNEIGRASCR